MLNQYSPRPFLVPNHYFNNKPPESPPKICIVTPSFNQAEFLERTICSVISQNYPALEYVVRDGGSTDGTVEILERYSHSLTHWESIPDRGQAEAVNRGFLHCTGEIMGYLNSDDLLLPGTLNYIADFFSRHPGVDVVYGHRILVDEHDREVGRWVMPPHENEVLAWVDYLPQETMFWRRDIWKNVGASLNEEFQFAMDWDLILRFLRAGAKFVRLPRFLGAFRVHPRQKTVSLIGTVGKREVDAIRKTIHGRHVSSAEAGWRARNYLLRHLLYHCSYAIGLRRY
jgi:glycosyltransferase involved in cell wall biosynthesis